MNPTNEDSLTHDRSRTAMPRSSERERVASPRGDCIVPVFDRETTGIDPEPPKAGSRSTLGRSRKQADTRVSPMTPDRSRTAMPGSSERELVASPRGDCIAPVFENQRHRSGSLRRRLALCAGSIARAAATRVNTVTHDRSRPARHATHSRVDSSVPAGTASCRCARNQRHRSGASGGRLALCAGSIARVAATRINTVMHDRSRPATPRHALTGPLVSPRGDCIVPVFEYQRHRSGSLRRPARALRGVDRASSGYPRQYGDAPSKPPIHATPRTRGSRRQSPRGLHRAGVRSRNQRDRSGSLRRPRALRWVGRADHSSGCGSATAAFTSETLAVRQWRA
ncbi:MAG: hypothetical protein JWP01_159 [Myxococcales bacterium]|nr:hypothetical protein [Myxococcales bacterium]